VIERDSFVLEERSKWGVSIFENRYLKIDIQKILRLPKQNRHDTMRLFLVIKFMQLYWEVNMIQIHNINNLVAFFREFTHAWMHVYVFSHYTISLTEKL